MAQYQSHISFSTLIALIYAFFGFAVWDIIPESVLLASVIVVITGMLPDVDATGGIPEREMGGLLAAIAPIFILELFPSVRAGGVTRIALVVILSYLVTRYIVVRGLQKFTIHRGMIHSIPASIIVFELAFLLFHDVYWKERMYLSAAAFIGFLSHLVLDGYSNLDIVGRMMGKPQKSTPALKVVGPTWGKTFILYGLVTYLGYFVMRDLYPGFRITATIQ